MTAIVTGAARGIGSAIADRLAKEGRDVLRVDLDPSVHGIQADITKPEDRARIIEAAGEVDVLVNNAGITRDARIVKMTEDEFLGVIRVNLGAAYELTMALTDRFSDGASVVSLASRAYLGNFGQFNYSASKGGLVGMTRALALQLAPRVRVNAIAPSLTASEMTLAMPEKVLSKMIASIPMGRMGEPEEIAATVAALASKDMAYVTGQVVVACGGRSLAP
jgi:NAD(P)-dependent dehydrogenase (short-subunit alcohol dehydrogenase family)